MSEKEKKARIARIKRYKKLKRIQSCRRRTKLNMTAAKMLTYASVPALAMFPSGDGGVAEARGYGNSEIVISADAGNFNHLQSVAVNHYNIDTAINNIVSNDGERFMEKLNSQYREISSHPRGTKRKNYVKTLFGDINYCNMAVIRALHNAGADYMRDFLNNLENPARCSSLIEYVNKTHPDCIVFVPNIRKASLKRGDVLIMDVARRDSPAVSHSGKHTVTFDGAELVSFNSESRYRPGTESGHIIDLEKIRKKELRNKISHMTKAGAVFYLMAQENRGHLEQEKTKPLPSWLLAQNQTGSGR